MIDLKNIQQQTKFNILLIGDSCTDEYKIGTVSRLSPEAPVPIIKYIDSKIVPGMAANVRKNLITLGLEPDFVTNDAQILKTRYIDQRSGQHLLRVDSEPYVPPWDQQSSHPINQYDAIVISDYNKGFLTYENIEHIINSTTAPIFIDTKKQDLIRFDTDHVYVKINESEYNAKSSVPKNLIVTLGHKGAMLKTYNLTEKLYPTNTVEVVDVCGCGDTFLAALTFNYLYTKNLDQAIMFANKAAGITVQHTGNYAPSIDEILNAGH